jgi:tol-pal system protein YbgF
MSKKPKDGGKTVAFRITGSIPVVLVTGVLLLGAYPAAAQSTKDRLYLLEQKVGKLERTSANNDAATDMLRRIQELQDENQALRNEIETLQFETVSSADRQRQLYIDLDQRMQALEAGGAGNLTQAAGAGIAAGQPAMSGSDTADYQAAFELLKQGRYPEAAAAFEGFLATYTSSDLRDNAQYWLAETHYVTKDYLKALGGFQEVINTYPASRKIPDAWLKVGYCNYELKQWADAREALSIASARYPETTAAKLAAQRLGRMKTEGH